MEQGLIRLSSQLRSLGWIQWASSTGGGSSVHQLEQHIRLSNLRGVVPDLDHPELYVTEWFQSDERLKELEQAKRFYHYLERSRVHPRCLEPIYRANMTMVINTMEHWWHARHTMLMLLAKFNGQFCETYKETSSRLDTVDHDMDLKAVDSLLAFIDSIESVSLTTRYTGQGLSKRMLCAAWFESSTEKWFIEGVDNLRKNPYYRKSGQRRITVLSNFLWAYCRQRSDHVPPTKRRRVSESRLCRLLIRRRPA